MEYILTSWLSCLTTTTTEKKKKKKNVIPHSRVWGGFTQNLPLPCEDWEAVSDRSPAQRKNKKKLVNHLQVLIVGKLLVPVFQGNCVLLSNAKSYVSNETLYE